MGHSLGAPLLLCKVSLTCSSRFRLIFSCRSFFILSLHCCLNLSRQRRLLSAKSFTGLLIVFIEEERRSLNAFLPPPPFFQREGLAFHIRFFLFFKKKPMEPIKEQADGDLKKEQYRKLNLELSKLEKNVQRLNHNVRDALEQAPSFRDMGTYHASM